MPVLLGRGTRTWSVVGTAGLKGPVRETGVHHIDTPYPDALRTYVNRISRIGQGAVEGKIEVDLKAETDFLQIWISLPLVIAAG